VGDVTSNDEAFPEGVYRAELVLPQVFGTDEPLVQTLTFDNGHWLSEDDQVECEGTYEVESGRVRVTLTTCGVGVVLDARWELQGDQLRFSDLRMDDPNARLIFAEPWTKIA
jgi:hypothetical protein